MPHGITKGQWVKSGSLNVIHVTLAEVHRLWQSYCVCCQLMASHPRASWLYAMLSVYGNSYTMQVAISSPSQAVRLVNSLQLWETFMYFWTGLQCCILLWFLYDYLDGLVQDCSISSANALEILQSCTEPSILCWYCNPCQSCQNTRVSATLYWSMF